MEIEKVASCFVAIPDQHIAQVLHGVGFLERKTPIYTPIYCNPYSGDPQKVPLYWASLGGVSQITRIKHPHLSNAIFEDAMDPNIQGKCASRVIGAI